MKKNIKKIVIITAYMGSGGAERVIAQLLKSWSSQFECSLILTTKDEIFYDLPSSIRLYEIGKQHSNRFVDKFLRYKAVRKLIKKIKPDVVLALPEDIGIYTTLALLGVRIPIVVSERNDPSKMPYVRITRILRHVAYHFVDGLIFQTNNAKEYFNKSIQKKSVILPNPLDLSRIPQLYEGSRTNVIASAGRLTPQKNFKLLMDAFEMFHKRYPDSKLVIYGEGEQREELEEYANGLKAANSICLPGNSKELLEKIKNAEMFVLSSDYEGIPNVLIEAMATGVPSISTDCEPGGAAVLINNNENGLLIPTGNVQKMFEAMEYIHNNPEIAINFSHKAIEIKKALDTEIVCGSWIDYLESIVEKTKT